MIKSTTARVIIRSFFRVLIFLLLFYVIYESVLYAFKIKNEEELSDGYYSLRGSGNDVVFVGPSTIMNAVYPMDLWDKYGFYSYNLGSGAQSVAMSYYLIKEAISKDHPSLIVLDCGRAFLDETVPADAFLHYITDNMPLISLARIQMITELKEKEDWFDFLFALGAYHERWKQGISSSDFRRSEKVITRGAKLEVNHSRRPLYELHEIDTKDAIGKTSKLYLDRIVDLCDRTGTNLLLMTIPFPGNRLDVSQEEYDLRRNVAYALEKYGKSKGIPYMNLFDQAEEIGIDPAEDTHDGEHLSIHGAKKFTDYLGEMLRKKYNAPVRKEFDQNKICDEEYDVFKTTLMEKAIKGSAYEGVYLGYLTDVLSEDDRYMAFILLNGALEDEEASGTFADRYECLRDISFQDCTAYLAVIDGGALVHQQATTSNSGCVGYETSLNDHLVSILCVSNAGDMQDAKVVIDGIDYSKRLPGVNIVVYDKKEGKVVDSALLETLLPDCPVQH